MNFGQAYKQALVLAKLPIDDAGHIELAKEATQRNIDDLWYHPKACADWRQSRSSITTVADADEYTLSKLVDEIVPGTMSRDPDDSPGTLDYVDPLQFFQKFTNHANMLGTPAVYTHGDLSGVDSQPAVPTKILIKSTKAKKTNGTVNFTAGSKRITSDDGIFSLNDVGLRIRKTGEVRSYKIGRFIDNSEIEIIEKFRGVSGDGDTYEIGDIGIHVNVTGFVAGEIDSEDIVLDGETEVTGEKNFTTLISISKTDRTGGSVTAQDEEKTANYAVLAPGETEVERKTVVLHPIPSVADQVIKYRFYLHHPRIWLDSDRIYLPRKFHKTVLRMTQADLLEWSEQAIPAKLAQDIQKGIDEYLDWANDTSKWTGVPNDTNHGSLAGLFDNSIDQDFVGV